LHQTILWRLEIRKSINQTSTEDVESTAENALERVKIMRVFDFVGMSEAVNEVRADLEASKSHEDTLVEPQPVEPIRQEIPDSEDEDDDMLLDWEPTQQPKEGDAILKPPSNESDDKMGLLLIDNIYHVVNPLLKGNYVQGEQAQLHMQLFRSTDI
jgi:hypothetical protein